MALRAPSEPIPGTPEYKARRAEPTMRNYDKLPKSHRALINEYGDSVKQALAFGMSPGQIKSIADDNGGVFEM